MRNQSLGFAEVLRQSRLVCVLKRGVTLDVGISILYRELGFSDSCDHREPQPRLEDIWYQFGALQYLLDLENLALLAREVAMVASW